MPQTIEPVTEVWESTPNRIRWTRAECEELQAAGKLTGRYELIDGEIISKMGQNPPHALAVGLVMDWLSATFGMGFVRVQATADAGGADPAYNEPEPDVAVLLHPRRSYPQRHPGPEDLLLVVEVSDSTLRFDRTKKAALYSLSGIQEYWALDLNGRRVFVHRQPSPDGYAEVCEYSADESIATLARPQEFVRVSELLP